MDTGVALDDEAAIDTALADAGITMERLSS
jgi:hypothetical protein